ncbi:MAG: CoA transferase [Candidatus Binatus sp.]|uniref:CaiB/BaiF CoA transferase family protein n=1 Tax=Candidatus Binatus sp. TaxID=2811406 RepID=UPI0027177597|nr:CoA transferase [Candidatus Binatus sp.]MDO8431254.1 CoA transferase [Candidatus Binatus sp.]
MNNEILGGVRVLDFTTIVSGPYCTRLLADLGAEVIKIEPPEGDFIRTQPPLRNGKSAYFAHLNCGKKSIALDFRESEAIALIRELAAKSDVVVENFRPGVMQRLGLDYAALAAGNPRLVYCSISGFGQRGPWATRSAYAPMLHAASGFDLVNLSYQNGLERPLNTGIYVGDVLGGTHAFGAIQSALLARERSGRGDCIDLSMMDGVLGMLIYEFQEAQFPQKKRANTFQPTRAKDGFIMIAAVKPNNFEALARAVGHPEWMTDPRFGTAKGRSENWAEFMSMLDEWASNRTAEECESILTAGNVPCSRYFTVREALQAEHLAQRGSFSVIDDGAGTLKVPNPAFKFDNAEARARNYVPALGADNADVLADVLGYSKDRIATLYSKRILRDDREHA